MKRSKFLNIFLCLCIGILQIPAQIQNKISFKKNSNFIYFFQKGNYEDTLTNSQGTVFYLLVPDSLKPYVSIQVENAQLLKTNQDSLVEVKYMKGMNYESIYILDEVPSKAKKTKQPFEFKTLVNGVNTRRPEEIEIQFVDKREKNVLLKNTFYFKN